jgi:hypothetical protein
LLYLAATAPHTPPLRERLKLIPLLVITGFGISLSTSIAVLQGLTKKGGAFVRTPKLNLGNSHKQPGKIDRRYLPPISPLVWAEIALVTGIVLESYVGWGIIPWMIIYMLGFFNIAGLNLIQHAPKAGG